METGKLLRGRQGRLRLYGRGSLTKEHIIRTRILPYFGKLKISEISTKEIITWQNEMLAYRDDPQGIMTAKGYKSKVAEPVVKRLKALAKTLMVRCFQAIGDYQRLNQTNANLYRSNERLKSHNKQLANDNNRLRKEIKDYKLLREKYLEISKLIVN